MRPTLRSIYFALLCVCFLLPLTDSTLAKSRDPIRVGLNNQTSQQVLAHIARRALVKAGFKVEFIQMGVGPNSTARVEMIASGLAHFQPVFAVADAEDDLAKALADKRIFSLGGLRSNGKDEPTLKIVWAGMRKKWPFAEKMLKTMIFPSEELDRMAQAVDTGNSTMDQVVDDWIKNNQPTWKRWVSASRNWMKP